MTLNDVARTLSQEKKCKVTLYDKVGDIVIIQCKKRKSSVVIRCKAMSRYNSYKLINEKYIYKIANYE